MAELPIKNTPKTVTKIKKLFFIFYILLIFCFQLKCSGADSKSTHINYKPDLIFSKNCHKENKEFKVIKVFDGDTIAIVPINSNKKTRYEKIRLLSIDAFEHDQFPYGPPAQKFLSMLILGKNVCIETDVDEQDKYGRTLGYIFLNEPTNLRANVPMKRTKEKSSLEHGNVRTLAQLFINEEVIKNGPAILYASEPNVKYKERLKKAVVFARTNMLGAWKEKDYILETPSEFRKKHPYKNKKSKHRKKNKLMTIKPSAFP